MQAYEICCCGIAVAERRERLWVVCWGQEGNVASVLGALEVRGMTEKPICLYFVFIQNQQQLK